MQGIKVATHTLQVFPPDPLHTYHGLVALRQIRPLSPDDLAKHHEWATMTLRDLIKTPRKRPPSTCLRHAALLVSSLRLLSDSRGGLFASVADSELIRMAVECWSLSARSVDDASDVLTIVNGCASGHECSIVEHIRSQELAGYEGTIVRSDPKSSLSDILALQKIEQVLYPDTFTTRPAMRQIFDNLSKSVFLRSLPA